MSWSIEKAPVLISSLSRAAAAFAESVCGVKASQVSQSANEPRSQSGRPV